MCSSKVKPVVMAHDCYAKMFRLLCLQSCQHARHAGSLWANVERILSVGLEISDIRSIRVVYGDSYSCMPPKFWNSGDGGMYVLIRFIGLLGPFIIRSCSSYHKPASPSASLPGDGVAGSDLWRRSILRDKHVRSLSQGTHILQTRSILFLVLLLFLKFHMDCNTWW